MHRNAFIVENLVTFNVRANHKYMKYMKFYSVQVNEERVVLS